MVKYYKLTVHILFLFVFICIVLLFALGGCKHRKMSKVQASQAFRQYVLDPIPASAKNIKADQPDETFGYIYTFRFNISREDLSLLINSQPFIRIWNLKYKNGMLEWGWGYTDPIELEAPKYGISLPLYEYGGRPHGPSWFRPGQWENPEAYSFYKIGDLINTQIFEQDGHHSDGWETIQILLYNEKEGEAYFIVSGREN